MLSYRRFSDKGFCAIERNETKDMVKKKNSSRKQNVLAIAVAVVTAKRNVVPSKRSM